MALRLECQNRPRVNHPIWPGRSYAAPVLGPFPLSTERDGRAKFDLPDFASIRIPHVTLN